MALMPQSPKNWPENIPYLTNPTYSPTLSQTHLSTLRTRTRESSTIPPHIPKGPSPLVRITSISSPSHPAAGQSGLFATKDLKPGTFILQYLGVIHSNSTSKSQTPDPHATSDYDLSLDRESGLGIDAATSGNEARFINDYRGVAARANAEFKEIWHEHRAERGMGVWVLPEGKRKDGKGKGRARGVKKGEEILVSYGRGFWGARNGGAGDDDGLTGEGVNGILN
ncbi:hypothetical protein B7494_g2336 [Chlorociboria aeruginascens]|nr:hypothetical protein B7494_g2336 [Chlorociboria aeruginascens]